jgi:nucleotide-binding universal stress UspA family protein
MRDTQMFDKILLAVDGSESSDVAVQTAIGFAAKTGASVEVVHVRAHDVIVSKGGGGPDLETREEASVILKGAADKLKDAGITVHGAVRQAPTTHVAREIIAAADEAGADLIVVGNRGLSSFSGMVLGSVSTKLVHLAGRPVLVAHERPLHKGRRMARQAS